MAVPLPPELSGLLGATDPVAREAAWVAFLEAHSRLLLHTARSLGRDYDATMDAYTHLLDQLRRDDFHRLRAYAPDGRSKFTTWLVVVARRVYLDLHRQRYGRVRETGVPRADERAVRRRLTDLVAVEIDPASVRDPSAADPEEELLTHERRAALDRALERLEPRDRLLLKLRFEDELSAREVAEVMGFPTAFHVYRRLGAVLTSVRRSLAQRGMKGDDLAG